MTYSGKLIILAPLGSSAPTNCPFSTSNEIISVIKYWYQVKAEIIKDGITKDGITDNAWRAYLDKMDAMGLFELLELKHKGFDRFYELTNY